MSLKQKILLGIVIAVLFISFIPIARRWKIERENRDVCITMDGQGLVELAAFAGRTPRSIVEELGLDSITLQPLTVKMLADRGGLRVTPLIIKNIPGEAAFAAVANPNAKTAFYYIQVKNSYVDSFFRANFPADFNWLPIDSKPGCYLASYSGGVDYGDSLWPDLLVAPLDFYPADLAAFKGDSPEIILRPRVGQNSNAGSLPEILAENKATRQVIFAGGKVWGYPTDIKETADLFIEQDMVWGFVEPFLALQSGGRELGKLLADKTARVHSIQQGEVNNLAVERVISRYLRAVRERNARILYLRPILKADSAAAMIAKNKLLVDGLKEALQKESYRIGDPGLYPPLSLEIWELGCLYCGLVAAFCLFLSLYGDFPKLLYLLIIAGSILAAGLLLFVNKINFLLQGSMLITALIGPLLPLLMTLGKRRPRHWDWLLVTAGTILGALFLSAFAVDRLVLLGIEYFRGVKFTLLLPLFLLAVYLFKEKRPAIPLLRGEGKPDLKAFLKPRLVAIFILLGLAIVFYIMRSGNYPLLSVPAWEMNLRNLLEKLFVIRPRFKEIFWGHPLLVLGLYMQGKKEYPWISILFILLGSMGQITIVNSFIHFHTPLWVSLWRTVMGVFIGGLMGVLAICLGKVLGLFKRRERSM